jgi:hypothetical protein
MAPPKQKLDTPAVNSDTNAWLDYEDDYAKESDSHTAAVSADADAANVTGDAKDRSGATADAKHSFSMLSMPAMNINTGYAVKKADRFRTMLDDYFAKYQGRTGENTVPYISMSFQRDGFIKDENALMQANMAYNLFVPAAEFFGREVVRIDSLQDVMPDIAADYTSFSEQLAPHEGALKETIQVPGGMNTSQGRVAQAQDEFSQSRDHLTTAMLGFSNVIMSDLMQPLMAMKQTKGDEKKKIESKMARLKGAIDTITNTVGMMGKIAKFATPLKGMGAEGVMTYAAGLEEAEHIGKGAEIIGGSGLGGAAAEIAYGPELKRVEDQINALDTEVKTWEGVKGANELEEVKRKFAEAKKEYLSKWDAFQLAMANQRSQYANTAKAVDKSETKGKIQQTKDPVQQIMLYLSAVREAKLASDDSKAALKNAKAAVEKADATMKEHTGNGDNYQPNQAYHQWSSGPGLHESLYIFDRPDFKDLQFIQNYLHNFYEPEAAKQELRLQALDKSAAEAMSKKGSMTGKY